VNRHVESRAALRFAIWAPPLAWVIQGLGSIALAAAACGHPQSTGLVRTGLGVLAGSALVATLLAIRAGWVAHRRFSGGVALLGDEAEARSRLLATGGVFLALTLGLGILWAALPIAMLGKLCEAAR
jgi:hypothetical protein